MTEKELDNEDYSEHFAQDHLKYIDEIEAIRQRKQNADNDEVQCMSPGLDVETIRALRTNRLENQTNFPPIFTKNRFSCKIPEHFFCQICSNVVKDPRECVTCENLLCKSCIDSVDTCPFGCETYQFKRIAKFAMNMYQSLTLDCKNKPFGCTFNGTIRVMENHEENCQFIVAQCENSLCDRIILKKEKTKENSGPLLCSEICENLIKFSILIDENNLFETLQNFCALSERCKKLIEYEVKVEMESMYKKIEEHRREAELYRKQKDRIEKDIVSWQNAYHPGKWNLRTNKWTCCGINDNLAVGCKHIG
jgi:hypothetical protein